LQALREKRKDLQEQFDELVQHAYNALAKTLPKDKNGKPKGAGVNLVRKSDDTGYTRESLNPLWYQNDYENGEKTPYSKKNMMNTAMEMVLGERKDMSDQYELAEYDASRRELRPMFEENQRMYDNIETLNAIEPKMQEIQQKLDKGSNVTKAAENKKAVSVETNIANGKKALERVIETHEDVENAMYREDVGDIDFVWGNEGTKEKDYENGYGIAKIIKKHGKEDAMKIPSVIATGNVVKRSENRMTIDSADDTGMRVIIRFDWDGKRRNWLLTGYTKNKSQSSPVTDDRRVTDTASRTSSAAETTDFPANTIPQNQQESKSENVQDKRSNSIEERSDRIEKAAGTAAKSVTDAGIILDECQQIVGRVRNRGQKGTPTH